jgi:UDP-glucose 4-epimerase
MKILITGCQGFVGKSLAQYAVSEGHRVLGVARAEQRARLVGVEYSCCDLDEPGFIDLLNNFSPDLVFHAAGSASVGYSFQQPREDFLMAVETWVSVLDAIRKADGNPLLMFPSSASVYGNPVRLPVAESAALRPISPYGFHKVICEQLAQEYCHCFGLNVVAARLFSTIGPYQQRLLVWELFRQTIEDTSYLTVQGTGTETRDFLHIDDVCRYFLGIAERKPEGFLAVNVASGASTSVRMMAEIVSRFAGNGQAIVTLNKDLPGDPKHWQADTTLLLSLVPYQASDIAQGLENCVRHWLAEMPMMAKRAAHLSLESAR